MVDFRAVKQVQHFTKRSICTVTIKYINLKYSYKMNKIIKIKIINYSQIISTNK